MLVYEYALKLYTASDKIVKIIKSKYEFSDSDIEIILKNHKQDVLYCEKTQQIRLHTNTLYADE